MKMSTFFDMYFFRFMPGPNMSSEGNVWMDGPTYEGMIVYSILTPIICCFGIVGNILSLMVLMKRQFKASIYVYLSVLAFTDLGASLLLFLGGLSRGILYLDQWPIFDAVVGVPLGGMFNCMSILATMAVTFDRGLFLRKPLICRKPKFCNAKVARRIMVLCAIISIITNLPYCLIFYWGRSGMTTNSFFYSDFFKIHNWYVLIIFGVLPSIFLTIGNGYLVCSLGKLKKMKAKCSAAVRCKKKKDFASITTTLILIVFFFLITEIPPLLISRGAAVTFFFSDRPGSPSNSENLEIIREITTVVSALGLAVNFLLYYLFCPEFYKAFVKMFKRRRRHKSIQMNVFVIGGGHQANLNEQKIRTMEKMTAKKILMEVMDRNNEESYPSSFDEMSETREYQNRRTIVTLCPQMIL